MNDRIQGWIEFGHRGYEINSTAVVGVAGLENASMGVVIDEAVSTFTDDDVVTPNSTTNTTTQGTTALVSGVVLEVVPRYNGQTMAAKDVFAIALDVMVLGAEKGPIQPVIRITTRHFDMVPVYDARGQTVFKYKALIKATRILMRWMVAKKRFGEMDIELRRDGVMIGIGRLKKGLRVSSQ